MTRGIAKQRKVTGMEHLKSMGHLQLRHLEREASKIKICFIVIQLEPKQISKLSFDKSVWKCHLHKEDGHICKT